MIKVASIGYGDIAQRSRFPELQQFKGRAELVAIAGRDEARMAECAKAFNIPKAYTDVDAMLADPAIDAVLILTPPDSHAEMAVRAVNAGKHVLLEKPMVMTVDEGRRIAEAVERNPVVFYPLPHLGAAQYDLLRQLLDAGAVGQVTHVECHKGHRGPTHAGWFYQKALAGGGVLFDLGVYGLGAIAYIFGPAERVSALCLTQFEERTLDDGSTVRPDVEDTAFVNLWLKSGVAATVNANWTGYLSHHHTRSRLVVFGREGMVHFGAPDGALYLHRADGNYDGLSVESEPAEFDGYACRRIRPGESEAFSVMGQFLARIEAGDTDTLALKRMIHVQEIMLTAYECGGLAESRQLTTDF